MHQAGYRTIMMHVYIYFVERASLIASAIEEANREFSAVQDVKLSNPQQKLHAFKIATPSVLAQANANLKFERMVDLAEKMILHSQRNKATIQTTSALAESLAIELLHTTGSILSKKEIAMLYEESNCAQTLPAAANCMETTSRLADGTCNNLKNPTFGAAGTRFRRLIPARYDDGVSSPRGFMQSQGSPFYAGVFSLPTPSARIASLAIMKDKKINDAAHSQMLMQWGQFIGNDMASIPEFDSCPDGCDVTEQFEGSCHPIAVPQYDRQVLVTRTETNSIGCIGFRRSLGACPSSNPQVTRVLPREQLNAITHFIDGSTIYHHDQSMLNTLLRDTKSNSGQLRTGSAANGECPN